MWKVEEDVLCCVLEFIYMPLFKFLRIEWNTRWELFYVNTKKKF